MKKILIATALVTLFFTTGFALAQEYGVHKQLTLTVGKAQTVDFNQPITEILVSNPSVVDVGVLTKRRIYVVGRGVGDTNVLVFDQGNGTMASLDVNVSNDQFTLQRSLRQYFPEEPVTARMINREVILTGRVSTPSKAGQIRDIAKRFVATDQTVVDLMTVEGEQQVMLQVKIVEVGRNVLKEYGIEPSIANLTSGNFSGALASNGNVGVTSTSFALGSLAYETANTGPISVAIRGLEEKGLLNTLAEPNLTAISGQHAEFLAGGEYPVPVAQQNNQITVEFKKFGVSLGFTPLVLSNDKIQLELETEVSTLSNEADIQSDQISIPSLNVRRAKTTIEMASGGSLMMAGLLQSDSINSLNSLPGVNKIPVIGKLFSSQSFQRNESELLVIVTPYLVRPTKKPAATLTSAYEEPRPTNSPQQINAKVPTRVHGPEARLDTTIPAGNVGRTNAGYWLE